MGSLKVIFFSVVAIVGLMGCGRAGTPFTPEQVAPQRVQQLNVTADGAGVKLAWVAPKRDRRGKALSSLEGYEIFRADLSTAATSGELGSGPVDATKDEAFAHIGTIKDEHLAKLEELRAAARREGKPTRRIAVAKELESFSFLDSNVKPGTTYVYRVQPFNHGGVLTRDFDLIQVAYRGITSEISAFSGQNLDDLTSETFSFEE